MGGFAIALCFLRDLVSVIIISCGIADGSV